MIALKKNMSCYKTTKFYSQKILTIKRLILERLKNFYAVFQYKMKLFSCLVLVLHKNLQLFSFLFLKVTLNLLLINSLIYNISSPHWATKYWK